MLIPTLPELLANGKKPEVLFWVGCAGSFDQRAKKISKSFVKILYKAEISSLAKKPSEYNENEITDLFFDKLEKQIRQNPSEYLWTHNRFKHMIK